MKKPNILFITIEGIFQGKKIFFGLMIINLFFLGVIFFEIGEKKLPAKKASGKAKSQAVPQRWRKSSLRPVLTIVITQDINTDIPRLIKNTKIIE